MVTFSWAGATDIGLVRRTNQDAVLPDDMGLGPGPVVVAVADGLGAYAGSEIASRLVIDAISTCPADEMNPEQLVAVAHQRLTDHIEVVEKIHPALVNMSTTLTLAILRPGGLIEIGHIGDSRAYGSDGLGIAQLTTDHTIAMDLVRAGRLAARDAAGHPGWHTMSNWLGREHRYWVETHALVFGRGDRLLLCSDGLSNLVPEDVIGGLLYAGTPDESCTALIDAANRAGGSDNISVVVVSVEM